MNIPCGGIKSIDKITYNYMRGCMDSGICYEDMLALQYIIKEPSTVDYGFI